MTKTCKVCEYPTSNHNVDKCELCLTVWDNMGKETTIPQIEQRIKWEERMAHVVQSKPFGQIAAQGHISSYLAYIWLLSTRQTTEETKQLTYQLITSLPNTVALQSFPDTKLV